MGLFRARASVRAGVLLHAPARASARLETGPADAQTDVAPAVVMGTGLVAAAHHRCPEPRRAGFAECLVEVASGIARAGAGDLPFALVHLGPLGVRDYLELVEWDESARGRIDAEVIAGRGGAVPRITAAPEFAGPSVEIAALALTAHLAGPADADLRMALALGVEGVLAWYREADPRTPPRDALAFALAHAADRMAEAGRSMPAGPRTSV